MAITTLGRCGVVMVLVIGLIACHDKKPAPPPPPAVGVLTLQARPVAITSTLPGRVTAYRTAEVRPQVGGVLQKRLFIEGQLVRPDQQLYQIDPAPYEATVASARATIAHAAAEVAVAQSTYDRYLPLAQAQAISQQDLDTAISSLRQGQADLASGEASLKSALINLAYTRVTSPIGGQTGRSSFTEGALVTANQTDSLVTVTQLDPIYVDVTQPSTTLSRFRSERASGHLASAAENALRVTLVFEDGRKFDPPGRLEFSEVTVDQGTGSVTLRTLFPNGAGILLPGMFVQETIEEGIIADGLLVPQRGITRDPKGDASVLLVGADGKVVLQAVVTDRVIGDDWLVSKGVKEGDRVILDGIQNAKPGATVSVTEAKPEVGDGGADTGPKTPPAPPAKP